MSKEKERAMDAVSFKEFAVGKGADLVGIAPASRFAGLPEGRSPAEIFPQFKTLIVLGRRILRGSLRGVEEGTNFGSTYGFFGFKNLEDNFLSRTLYESTCFIEEQGFEAVPLFAYNEEGMAKGIPVKEGKVAPNVIVDFEFAATAAGLGAVGDGGFFLTPEYGTRQRFGMILTDAEIEPDEAFAGHVCEPCGVCAAACPFDAISEKNGISEVDYAICEKCPNGAMQLPGRGSRPDRIAAACGRALMDYLEREGLCGNKFKNRFRKRTPWAVDMTMRPVDVAAREG